MKNFRLGIVLLTVFLVGCAVGNTYDYRRAKLNLVVQGSSIIGLAVIDQRPYILSGEKDPNFVGLIRGGFGNPFTVKTRSGYSLASEMYEAMAFELEDNGFTVVKLNGKKNGSESTVQIVRDSAAERSIVLTVREWRTDGYFDLKLSHDLSLKVMDEYANVLAESQTSGINEVIGGVGLEAASSISAANAFSSKIEAMINNQQVMQALKDLH